MPEIFDYATTDPGSGGENLAGDRITQSSTAKFVPCGYLVFGPQDGPFERVNAGSGLPVSPEALGEFQIFATAARTTEVTSATFTNKDAQGLLLVWTVTANSEGNNVSIQVQMAPVHAPSTWVSVALFQSSTVGTYLYWLHPNATISGGMVTVAQAVSLPHKFRIKMEPESGFEVTYGLSASFVK
jgi:hypothetical protein